MTKFKNSIFYKHYYMITKEKKSIKPRTIKLSSIYTTNFSQHMPKVYMKLKDFSENRAKIQTLAEHNFGGTKVF